MSTSPSWFDQEKFSRLVKKVGPKTITEVLPSSLGSETDKQPSTEGLASTARISLVSKPPSLLSEQRALPALPRRTSPLPSLKALFPPPQTPPSPSTDQVEASEEETTDLAQEEGTESLEHEADDNLTEIWHKMSLLNEELARAIQERDQALNEGALLREQLRRADEEMRDEKKPAEAPSEDLAKLTKERDDAIAETEAMRAQLLQVRESTKQTSPPGKTQELGLLTDERDQARRQYSELRKQFETLKQEQAPKEETVKFRKEWEQQIGELKQKLEERDKEIALLKANSDVSGGDEKLREEAASLREQLARVKDELSIAQRGLALSQKALQQTRDTLREATEGTSLSRHNFDNLKNECATLAQQNSMLQTQNDQLTRDLAAAKSKITTRLQQ